MKSQQSGFSMIEVLVTIAILVIGLLGLAALQTVTTMAQFEAYQRSQALVLLQEMADRMEANKSTATTMVQYVQNDIGLIPVDCTAKTGAALDICQWGNELNGASEATTGGVKTGAMIGARGCITTPSPNVYMITVAWQGFSRAGSPAAPCGVGAYGPGKRRTVSTVIRVGLLGF